MKLCFDTILQSKLGYENSDAGCIKCWRRPHLARQLQVPRLCSSRTSSTLSCPHTQWRSWNRFLL